MPTERRNVLLAALNTIGGMSGLLSIAIVVFQGGALVERVRGMDIRLSTVEAKGSRSLETHATVDDERDAEGKDRDVMLGGRITELEKAMSRLGVIESKLDKVLERVIIGK